MTDIDVAAAVRLAARAEVIASEAEHTYAYADPGYPSSPYPAAFAAVLRHLIGTGNAEALQVAVSEFEYFEDQTRQEEEQQRHR